MSFIHIGQAQHYDTYNTISHRQFPDSNLCLLCLVGKFNKNSYTYATISHRQSPRFKSVFIVSRSGKFNKNSNTYDTNSHRQSPRFKFVFIVSRSEKFNKNSNTYDTNSHRQFVFIVSGPEKLTKTRTQ